MLRSRAGDSSVGALLLQQPNEEAQRRLGTGLGVFVPVSCTIFGVVVFLRLGLVVGQVGFKVGVAIISGGFLIAFLTVLSLCALITNGPVETGKLGSSASHRPPRPPRSPGSVLAPPGTQARSTSPSATPSVRSWEVPSVSCSTGHTA